MPMPTLTKRTVKGSALTHAEMDANWDAIMANAGDVFGPASAVDNALARYDTTTGKLLQDSRSTLDDNGELRLFNGGVGTNPAVVAGLHVCVLNADFTLTSTVAQQKLFNASTNGTLTLPTGTYLWGMRVYITGMSATSGNGTFDIKGAGTATITTANFSSFGTDDSAPSSTSAITGQPNGTTTGKLVQSDTGTAMSALARGMFRLTVAGTIIPSITLDTAAAATVNNGSWFYCQRIGSSVVTTVGNWS